LVGGLVCGGFIVAVVIGYNFVIAFGGGFANLVGSWLEVVFVEDSLFGMDGLSS
jgi:hypothetical protein